MKFEYRLINDIFRTMGDGFLIMDMERRIKYMNPHLIDAYGDHCGKKCHEMYFGYSTSCKGCIITNILKKDSDETSTIRCVKDKLGRWLEITTIATKTPYEDNQREDTYVVELIHDITARKRLTDTLRIKNQELIQKNQELENFVYTVSHDLKSPIISLQGIVGILFEDYGERLEGEMKEYLFDIKNSTDKMGLLIQDLLNLSRVGRTRNPRHETPAREIISEAVEQLKFKLEEKGVELYIQEDLPVCYCDKQMIIMAIVNLIDNAIKFMGENPYPIIEVGCKTKLDSQVFYVKDNGIGIDPKYHEKIFEIFQTLDEIKDPTSTGVGLAIVKRAVDAHMGKVWVESEKGKGASFYICLPDKKTVIDKTGQYHEHHVDRR